ncbi:TraH family protein [Rhizobium panacihumi]|uniref:TraH family protein n=1 Tax=Rhizobium panacihumi TaxID=2008450 RepID=UPI003D7C06BC
MLDAALIQQCADPSLKPAIVEQFVATVGSTDPLAVTVKAGGRLILVPKPKTPEEAMDIIHQNVGHAVVRVGLTQLPAGIGITDVSQLTPDLVEPCGNLKAGTAMFAKVLRIVAKWYGNPNNDVFPQVFEDATFAWRTGEFEGENVFQAGDPGGQIAVGARDDAGSAVDVTKRVSVRDAGKATEEPDIGTATIRVDLSRLQGTAR